MLRMVCRGDASAASVGSILVTRLMMRGGGGLVTDGGLTDSPQIASFDIPCFTRGASAPTNLIKHQAVEQLNRPITCGGVAIYPGDIMVGDREGLVAIPAHLAKEVAHEAHGQERQECFIISEIRAGKALRGVYPPNEETHQRYDAWTKN